MKSLISSLLAAVAVGLSASAWAAQPLLTPTELNGIRQNPDVRVIDIRLPKEYAAGHIPGAVSAPYGQWRGPADDPGKLPPEDKLVALVRSLGLDANTHAVVVSSGADSTDFGGSARVYWTLKYLGLTNLSILNGGLKAWAGAGLAQDRQVPSVAPTQYAVHLDESLIATTKQVAAQVNNPQTRLIDARPRKFYLGDVKAPTALVPGTIKGAVSLENGKWFKPGTSIFVDPEKARQIAAAELAHPAQETISFCNTGHWAATDWFALSEVVGVKNVRLYPASLAEWTHDSSLPMQNVPSRGKQILMKLKGLVS
ncbi:sulfurtransferase [Candidimonas nitroreducens]|uniref:Sulfurtransferase n=1 Tax=Candidimonas nitroreducens TaxID=683354 RepID=A0A225M096_9BURK|nr:sulfurtransferase [Candidimonas nitroreducens]OWT54804.1 sulfurtransferase [Candidimonas nitroreducens]